MIIQEKDYLKHWGMKGMKWDTTKLTNAQKEQALIKKTQADSSLAIDNGLVPPVVSGNDKGYYDNNGKFYKGTIQQVLISKKVQQTIKNLSINSAGASLKVKNIGLDVIKKGQSFLNKFFGR